MERKKNPNSRKAMNLAPVSLTNDNVSAFVLNDEINMNYR